MRNTNNIGFSVIEVLLAAAIFVIFAGGIAQVVLHGYSGNRLGEEQTIANNFASEGIEAVRSIKNQAYSGLANSVGTGITQTGGVWAFSGANNTFGKYSRVITVADVYRDGSGNIVASGGTLDPDTKNISSMVSWNFNAGRSNSIELISYLTDFKKPIVTNTGSGILVYGDGGVTTDAIKYKKFDGTNWQVATASADVDTGSTNKYLRTVKIYSSKTRNEKIMVSRHYNGTGQWIYAQVYNGSTNTWGNVVQLSTWNLTTLLNVRNFDGDYLANGDFAVVYSDNTTTPKMRVWNGTSWNTQSNLNAVTGTPSWIVVKARPNSNEIMAVFLGSTNRTMSEYNNGVGYATANWTTATSHANAAVLNTKKVMDFEWSTNLPTSGIIVYSNLANDKNFAGKVFVANGTGGGAWGSAASMAVQTNNLGNMVVINRPGVNEMEVCNKDGAGTPTIVCRKLTFSGNVITWATPTNPIVSAASDTGIQRSFDIEFENTSGTPAIIVYGDNTSTLKYKKFTAGTATYDLAATNVFAGASTFRTVLAFPKPSSDDILYFAADTNLDVFSIGWDGTAGAFYGAGNGWGQTTHGTNGSNITNYWYDFGWDQ